MHQAILDFHGTSLRIRSQHPDWTEHLMVSLPSFRVEADNAGDEIWSLDLLPVEAAPSLPELPLVFDGRLPDLQEARAYQSDDRVRMVMQDGSLMEIDFSKRQAVGYLAHRQSRSLFGSALMTVLDTALFADGQTILHAACLINPDDGKALVFCVPSGGGKTTTALALARAGFHLMSDDVTVVSERDGRIMVWGLPRSLKVHNKTADLMPWIEPPSSTWNTEGEQPITLAHLKGRVALASGEPVPLGAFVLIGDRSPEGHRFGRLAKAQMLIALAHDNIGLTSIGPPGKSMITYRFVARLIERFPTFLLNAGPELDQLGPMIRAHLAGARSSK